MDMVFDAKWQATCQKLLRSDTFMVDDFQLARSSLTFALESNDMKLIHLLFLGTIDSLYVDVRNLDVPNDIIFQGFQLVTFWWKDHRISLRKLFVEYWPEAKSDLLVISSEIGRDFREFSQSSVFQPTPPGSPRNNRKARRKLKFLNAPAFVDVAVQLEPEHSAPQIPLDVTPCDEVAVQPEPEHSAPQIPLEVSTLVETYDGVQINEPAAIIEVPVSSPSQQSCLQTSNQKPDTSPIQVVNPTSTSPSQTPSTPPQTRKPRSKSWNSPFTYQPDAVRHLEVNSSAFQKPEPDQITDNVVFPCQIGGAVWYFSYAQYCGFLLHEWMKYITQAQIFFIQAWDELGALAPAA